MTPHGVVSVLICYDAYDPSVFLTATRLYQHSKIRNGRFLHHGVDIFIVPSYNSSPQLVRMCESLSYLTNTVVVYLSGDPKCTTKAEVFVCGRSVDLCHMQMGAEESEFFKKWKSSDQQITYFEIDSDLLTFAMRFRQNKLGILGLGASEMALYKPLGREALG